MLRSETHDRTRNAHALMLSSRGTQRLHCRARNTVIARGKLQVAAAAAAVTSGDTWRVARAAVSETDCSFHLSCLHAVASSSARPYRGLRVRSRDPECYPPPLAVERELAGTLMRATSPATDFFSLYLVHVDPCLGGMWLIGQEMGGLRNRLNSI